MVQDVPSRRKSYFVCTASPEVLSLATVPVPAAVGLDHLPCLCACLLQPAALGYATQGRSRPLETKAKCMV